MSFGCGNRCCGFLARSGMMLSGLTASMGYGSCSDADIIFQSPDLGPVGVGRVTRISAIGKRGPRTILRAPGRIIKGVCSRKKG